MSDNTAIEWTDATWNPVTGCTKVSPGCDNCYAEKIVERFNGKGSFAVVRRSEDKVYLPLKWKRPRRIFVNSMSDLFHDDVPDGFIANVFSVMARAPQHTFQVLTKRHGRMRSLLNRPSFRDNTLSLAPAATWPLPNVWLGVSVENQQWADIRIPALLDTPAAVRWISAEPLLDSIKLEDDWMAGPPGRQAWLNWVVIGGESGPGARPMSPMWARSLRDQCNDFGTAFLFKQWGAWGWDGTGGIGYFKDPERLVGPELHPFWSSGHYAVMRRVGKKAAGRELDGRTWDEYPDGAS